MTNCELGEWRNLSNLSPEHPFSPIWITAPIAILCFFFGKGHNRKHAACNLVLYAETGARDRVSQVSPSQYNNNNTRLFSQSACSLLISIICMFPLNLSDPHNCTQSNRWESRLKTRNAQIIHRTNRLHIYYTYWNKCSNHFTFVKTIRWIP